MDAATMSLLKDLALTLIFQAVFLGFTFLMFVLLVFYIIEFFKKFGKKIDQLTEKNSQSENFEDKE